jgi:hypothetical protein
MTAAIRDQPNARISNANQENARLIKRRHTGRSKQLAANIETIKTLLPRNVPGCFSDGSIERKTSPQ